MIKKLMAVLLSAALLAALLPVRTLAADGGYVCQIGSTYYTTLEAAAAAAYASVPNLTISVLKDYSTTAEISIRSTNLTLQLNGHTLNIGQLNVISSLNITIAGPGTVNTFSAGSGLFLDNVNGFSLTAGAQLNVTGGEYGARVGTTRNCTVSNVRCTGDAGYGVFSVYSPNVVGDLNVTGDVRAKYLGVCNQGGTVSVGGNVIVDGGNTLSESIGLDGYKYVYDWNARATTIGGDVVVSGANSCKGILSDNALVTVGGALLVKGNSTSSDILLGSGNINFSLSGGTDTADGYRKYEYYSTWVKIKKHLLTVSAGAGGSVSGSGGSYPGGMQVSVSATPRNHYRFGSWSSAGGGTFADPNSANTTFTVPGADTAVTANFVLVNSAPVRKSAVPATAAGSADITGSYYVDLSGVFEDADNDPLTYKVSVGGAEPVPVGVGSGYSYSCDTAGTVTLRFTANDGYIDSTDTYTVTLTVNKLTPSFTALTASPSSPQSYPVNVALSTQLYGFHGNASNRTITFWDGDTLIGSVSAGLSAVSVGWNNPSAGVHSIVARCAGDEYNNDAASAILYYTVAKGSIVVSDPGGGNHTYGDAPFQLGVSGADSGSLSYVSSDTGVLTVSATGVVTILRPGTAAVTATRSADDNYTAVNQTISITVAKKVLNATITPNHKDYDGTAAATTGGVSYSGIVGSDDVSVSGGTLSFNDKNAGAGKKGDRRRLCAGRSTGVVLYDRHHYGQ